MTLPDPDASRAILIGSSRFADPELLNLPSVRNNVVDLAEMLSDRSGGCIRRDHIEPLQDKEMSDVGAALRVACSEATDLLVVYYAGHGELGDRNQLYLTLPSTSRDMLDWTAIPFSRIAEQTEASPARQRVVILDCCFSGRAAMGSKTEPALVDSIGDLDRTFVLASAPANSTADAPVGARYTAFSGELIELLRRGVPGGPELLDIELIFTRVAARLETSRLPVPRRKVTGTSGSIVLSVNNALPGAPGLSHSTETPNKTLGASHGRASATDSLLWSSNPSSDVMRRLDSIIDQAHAATGLGQGGRPDLAANLLESLIADALVLAQPGDQYVLTLKALFAVWLRHAQAFAESAAVAEEILSHYNYLDLEDRWLLSVAINYALALGALRRMDDAVRYADMITDASRDQIVHQGSEVLNLRLARIDWARRDGDLEGAAQLAATLLGEIRIRSGFSSDVTFQVEREYRKILKHLDSKKAMRARLRSAQSTAWTFLRDNW